MAASTKRSMREYLQTNSFFFFFLRQLPPVALRHKMIIKIHCPPSFSLCRSWRGSTIKRVWNWAGGPEKDPEDQVGPLWSYSEQRTRSLSAQVMLNKLSWMHLQHCSKVEDLKGPILCLCWVLLARLICFCCCCFCFHEGEACMWMCWSRGNFVSASNWHVMVNFADSAVSGRQKFHSASSWTYDRHEQWRSALTRSAAQRQAAPVILWAPLACWCTANFYMQLSTVQKW